MAATTMGAKGRNSRPDKDLARKQIVDLFAFPAVYDLGRALDGLYRRGVRGAKTPFDGAVMIIVKAAYRAGCSALEAHRLLADADTWQQCAIRYEAMTDKRLPAAPPTRDQVEHFWERVAQQVDVVEALEGRFVGLAVAQARAQGNLLPDQEREFTAPDKRHTIYGDGTYYQPYSDAYTVVHPVTGEQALIGSRARSVDTARIQRVRTDPTADGKDAVGVNHIAVHTWTAAGRVVLGVGHTLGAEVWGCLDILDAVAQAAGDGVHTVVWDRVITGWVVDYLMGRHGWMTVNKNVARSTNDERASSSGVDAKVLERRAHRVAAEYDTPATPDITRVLSQDLLRDVLLSDGHLPLGTSVYKTTKGYEISKGRIYALDPISHVTGDGNVCTHELYVDDGALYTVEHDPVEGRLVKTGRGTCTGAVRETTPAGHYTFTSTWAVPCPNGDATYQIRWAPEATRHTQASARAHRTPLQGALSELRVISRADEKAFAAVHGLRNDSESYNNWAKRRLPNFGRAASLHFPAQRVDFLATAILNNSITWSRHGQ